MNTSQIPQQQFLRCRIFSWNMELLHENSQSVPLIAVVTCWYWSMSNLEGPQYVQKFDFKAK